MTQEPTMRWKTYRPGTKPLMALELLCRCVEVPVGDVSGMTKAGFTLLEKKGCVRVKRGPRGLAYRWPDFQTAAEEKSFWDWLSDLGISAA